MKTLDASAFWTECDSVLITLGSRRQSNKNWISVLESGRVSFRPLWHRFMSLRRVLRPLINVRLYFTATTMTEEAEVPAKKAKIERQFDFKRYGNFPID